MGSSSSRHPVGKKYFMICGFPKASLKTPVAAGKSLDEVTFELPPCSLTLCFFWL